MEVHAHTHTPRKKWTNYFWEFFMMFLAVFCGFLAENFREHIVEGNRAKEYATLLIQDLKSDSAYVQAALVFHSLYMQQADSLTKDLSQNTIVKDKKGFIRRFLSVGTMADFKSAFHVNFEQIKNSGSLRYFKNKKLVSNLSGFDRLFLTTSEVYRDYDNFILQNFTPFIENNLNTLQFDVSTKNIIADEPDIYDLDKRNSIVLANKINLKKAYDVFFIRIFLKQCAGQITVLINELKEEYHL